MKHIAYFWSGINGWVICSVLATITFVSYWFSVSFPIYFWFAAAASTELIYSIDHWADARRAKDPQTLSFRHRIFKEYPTIMLLWISIVAGILVFCIFYLPRQVFLVGIAGVAAIAVWYFIRYIFLRKIAISFWLKAVGISMGYVLGLWGTMAMFLHTQGQKIDFKKWAFPMIGYVLIALINVLICANTQINYDIQHGFEKDIDTKVILKYLIGITGLFWLSLSSVSFWPSICCVFICLGFYGLHQKPILHTFFPETQLADALLVIPLVLPLCRFLSSTFA